MNHYPHHIGDYDADTAHLDWLHDMAYTRLMRLCYRTEAPIPADVKRACVLVRARSKQECAAVESVLKEFFTLGADGWHQKRIDEEIEVYKAKADANRTNGKKGGRPKAKDNPQITQVVSVGKPNGFENETQNNLNQNQNQNQNQESNLPLAEIEPTVAGKWAVDLISRGVKASSMNPTLLAWIDEKIPFTQIVESVGIARQYKPLPELISLNYVDRVLRTPQKAQKPAQPQWWASDAGIEGKGRELGLTPLPGEGWPQFKDRINAKLSEQRAA